MLVKKQKNPGISYPKNERIPEISKKKSYVAKKLEENKKRTLGRNVAAGDFLHFFSILSFRSWFREAKVAHNYPNHHFGVCEKTNPTNFNPKGACIACKGKETLHNHRVESTRAEVNVNRFVFDTIVQNPPIYIFAMATTTLFFFSKYPLAISKVQYQKLFPPDEIY